MASILKPKSRKQLIEDFCASNKVYSNELKRLMTMYRWWHRGMFVWIYSVLQLILGMSIVVNNIISQSRGYFWYPVKWGGIHPDHQYFLGDFGIYHRRGNIYSRYKKAN